MGGHFIFLGHWHGGDPPTTPDLDTEISKEMLLFSCVFGKNQKIHSHLGKDYFLNIFYTIFKDLLWDPPSHCNQAINSNYVSDLSHFCPIFPYSKVNVEHSTSSKTGIPEVNSLIIEDSISSTPEDTSNSFI